MLTEHLTGPGCAGPHAAWELARVLAALYVLVHLSLRPTCELGLYSCFPDEEREAVSLVSQSKSATAMYGQAELRPRVGGSSGSSCPLKMTNTAATAQSALQRPSVMDQCFSLFPFSPPATSPEPYPLVVPRPHIPSTPTETALVRVTRSPALKGNSRVSLVLVSERGCSYWVSVNMHTSRGVSGISSVCPSQEQRGRQSTGLGFRRS